MPNTFATEGLQQLARAFVAGLHKRGTLLHTIYRDAEGDLTVGRGDTVMIREPLVVPASNFVTTTTVADLDEGKFAVLVDQQPYNQVKITAREAAMSIEQLATQVIRPQVAGVAEFIDTAVGAKLATTTGAVSDEDPTVAVAKARASLTKAGVPMGDRWLAVDPDFATLILTSPAIKLGNYAGAENALAEGVIGRLLGFNVVESPFVTGAVAYHRTAVAGVFRNPPAPQGAKSGSETVDGLTAQTVYAYDAGKLSDVLTVHTLFGTGTSDKSFNSRAVKVTVGAAAAAAAARSK